MYMETELHLKNTARLKAFVSALEYADTYGLVEQLARQIKLRWHAEVVTPEIRTHALRVLRECRNSLAEGAAAANENRAFLPSGHPLASDKEDWTAHRVVNDTYKFICEQKSPVVAGSQSCEDEYTRMAQMGEED